MRKVSRRICSVEGCDRNHLARGYCSAHYQRHRLRGTPALIPPRDLPGEVWRRLERFPNYEVSNLGRVRYVGPQRGPTWPGKHLNQTPVQGYRTVCVRHANGKPVTRGVHGLVAEAFHGPRPDGCVVNHKDFDRENNRPENLEWVTQGQNVRHAIEGGHWPSPSKPWAKMTPENVREIRRRHTDGESLTTLGREYGIATATVCDMVKRRTWKDVE